MPRKLPPFVECWRDRHGKMRAYYRRDHGPRIALPNSIGSPVFNRAYQAALVGRLSGPTVARPDVAGQGTIEALVRSYMQSWEYRDLRVTTKTGYASRLEAVRSKHGHRLVAEMTRERIVKAFLEPYNDRPGAALSILKMVRVLIRHAITLGWLDRDPSLGHQASEAGRGSVVDRRRAGAVRGALADRHDATARLRLDALHRATTLGRAPDDVGRRGRQTRSEWCSRKTGAKLTIALHADLRAILTETKRKHVAILTTEYGRAFTVDGFSGFMRDAIQAAGLPLECQPHGLRKAAGRRLAEAGCSTRELMAVLGHKTLSEAERYTRDAEQARLASVAVARLEGRSVNS